jgi:transposase
MKDTQLYSQILGIGKPWKVTDVKVSLADDEVEVTVVHGGGKLACPQCGKKCPGYDKRPRRWRHLDTCQLKTLLVANVPRVECAEHGVVTVSVPWSEPGSGFTALFEALVINWLKAASISAVSDQSATELECGGRHHATSGEARSVAPGRAVTQAAEC